MGLTKHISGGTGLWERRTAPVKGEPVPCRFEIKFATSIGRFSTARIKYPDCTNYEGMKIVVFKDTPLSQLYKMAEIDPHFSESSNIVARFAPTEQGMKNALRFCRMANRFIELEENGK